MGVDQQKCVVDVECQHRRTLNRGVSDSAVKSSHVVQGFERVALPAYNSKVIRVCHPALLEGFDLEIC